MGTTTKIEWLAGGHTASPWHGCAHVHAGCINCYAERQAARNPGTLGVWGPNGTRVASKTFHANCRKWNAAAKKAGVRASVFPSICDPFEEWDGPILLGEDFDGMPFRLWHFKGTWSSHRANVKMLGMHPVTMVDLRRELFRTMDACPMLDFLLLTKRPGNVAKEVCDKTPRRNFFRRNVQMIYSASDQETLEMGIDDLLECRPICPVLGLSLEPLIGPVDLSNCIDRLDWVIVGGESGPLARPCDINWIDDIVDQCRAASIPCFVKQLGQNVIATNDGVSEWFEQCPHLRQQPTERLQGAFGRVSGFTHPKAGDWDEWPEGLRVREYPKPQQ